MEKTLWHSSRQRRTEFGDLLETCAGVASGPGLLRMIRDITGAAQPLGRALPTQRSDIRLYRIRMPGCGTDVHVLRRDAGDEVRDLRRLTRADDDRQLARVIAEMEKSAFQSRGRSAAARGESISQPHLADLWERGGRRQEFGAMYNAYVRLPDKQDTTGAGFLSALHQLTIEAGQRGLGRRTAVADIERFDVRVPGTADPVQVLRRQFADGRLADIRLTSSAALEEDLDRMQDSQARGRGSRKGSLAPRRDQRLRALWVKRLERQLAGAVANFHRARGVPQPGGNGSFILHLDELCDQHPGEAVDTRYGISRHIVTPLASSEPIVLLRRKEAGELGRLRVVDGDASEEEALRSLRAVGPKRKPAATDRAGAARPGKRRRVAGTAGPAPGSGAWDPGLHQVIVPQQNKHQKVDVVYLVTAAAGRERGGVRTLGWAYQSSPQLIRPPRSYAGDRDRQALRWLCTALRGAFPGGREVQAYHDSERNEIWVSSNSRGTNRKLRKLLKEGGLPDELRRQVESLGWTGGSYPSDRNERHPLRLKKALDAPSAQPSGATQVLEAMAQRRFKVPTEAVRIEGRERLVDLHGERRIKRAYEGEMDESGSAAGRVMDPTQVVGTRRMCGTCAADLGLPAEQPRGPFWRSVAGKALIDMKAAIATNLANGVPTYVSRGRDGDLNLYVTDSESDG